MIPEISTSNRNISARFNAKQLLKIKIMKNTPNLPKSFPDFGNVLTQCKNDTFESKNLATFAILKLKIVGR